MTMFKSKVAALAGAMAAFIGTAHVAHASDHYIAEIRTFGEAECPGGWIPTDGRMLENRNHPALESIILDRFGSNSRQTFAVPKLPPLEGAPHKPEMRCIAANGNYPFGHNPYAQDHFIGEIRLFATRFCPQDWLPTIGLHFRGEDYYGLFALLGHRYGGQGSLFRVPDNPVIVADGGEKLSECIAAVGIFPRWN